MKHRKRFTLIELLVVIAIIAILAALLLPMLSKVKETGRKVACISNQKQILMLMVSYTSSYKGYYPPNKMTFRSSGLSNCYYDYFDSGMGVLLQEGGADINLSLSKIPASKIIFCPSRKPDYSKNTGSANYWLARSYFCSWDGAAYGLGIAENDGFVGSNNGLYRPWNAMQKIENVRQPAKKAYMTEFLSPGVCEVEIPGAGPFSVFYSRYTDKSDITYGRHNKTLNLGFFDGHVESPKGESTRKNMNLSGSTDAQKAAHIMRFYYY